TQTVLDFSHVSSRDLDDFDSKILQLMSKVARIKLIDIARKTGKNARTISYRIKRLEKDGIIAGYNIQMNQERIEYSQVQIDITLRNRRSRQRVYQFFEQTGRCIVLHDQIGRYDLSLDMYIRDTEELKDILTRFQELFADDYAFYDVSDIYSDVVFAWTPG
ncbi:MAG: Lrp/AsnC family transcriptional regulator, partial [Nanoarchaeota archaeon]